MIDQTGTVLLSKRVGNDENALLELIATITEIADEREVCWSKISVDLRVLTARRTDLI
nr:hypothetical protein [Arthrobacter sp. SLBN-112]